MMLRLDRNRVVEPSSSSRGVPARRSTLVAALALTVLMLGAVPAVAMGKATHEPAPDMINAPAGTIVSVKAEDAFDDAGTSPEYTSAVILFRDYVESHSTSTDYEGISRFFLRIKSAETLNALPTPPANPIHTVATVTIKNDEGQTLSRSLTFVTRYRRIASSVPGSGQPTAIVRTLPFQAPAGSSGVGILPDDVFDNAGTNPVFTEVTFSPADYYAEYGIHDSPGATYHGTIYLTVKSNRQLNALPSPPDSPLEVTATVTMTNDEEQTATATFTISTEYLRDET